MWRKRKAAACRAPSQLRSQGQPAAARHRRRRPKPQPQLASCRLEGCREALKPGYHQVGRPVVLGAWGSWGRLSPAQLPASPCLCFPRGAQYWGECLPACLLALPHWVATASSLTHALSANPCPLQKVRQGGGACGHILVLHVSPGRCWAGGGAVGDAAGLVPHEAQRLGFLAAGHSSWVLPQCHGRLAAAPLAHWRVEVAPPPLTPLRCTNLPSFVPVPHLRITRRGPRAAHRWADSALVPAGAWMPLRGGICGQAWGGVRWKGRAPTDEWLPSSQHLPHKKCSGNAPNSHTLPVLGPLALIPPVSVYPSV